MKISLVVPVFNEEEAIPIFYKTVREFEELKQHEVEIVFINDGSKDATESIINALAIADPLVVRSHLPATLVRSLLFSPGWIMPLVMQSSLSMSTCRTLLKSFRT
jgi:glycosyltransferase involved in cell wall biosynthesis